MYNRYYIIYPRGDRSKLAVVECIDYEVDDYAVASQTSFDEEGEAVKYAEQLALKNNKEMKYPYGYKDYLD